MMQSVLTLWRNRIGLPSTNFVRTWHTASQPVIQPIKGPNQVIADGYNYIPLSAWRCDQCCYSRTIASSLHDISSGYISSLLVINVQNPTSIHYIAIPRKRSLHWYWWSISILHQWWRILMIIPVLRFLILFWEEVVEVCTDEEWRIIWAWLR